MLLANVSVAQAIVNRFPSCSLLRRHQTPGAGKVLDGVCVCGGLCVCVWGGEWARGGGGAALCRGVHCVLLLVTLYCSNHLHFAC
jgi:hypothetical protein